MEGRHIALQSTLKKAMFFLLLFFLLTSLLAACGNNTAQFSQQPAGDSVGACGAQFTPDFTMLHPSTGSTQSIYFISGVHLYALNAGNGALHWCIHASNLRSRSDMALQTNALSMLGPPPPPDGLTGLAVSSGTIYACSMNGYTYAFDASSGAMYWHQQTGENTSVPTYANDMVFVGSDNIYELDAQNGRVRWKTPTQDVVSSSPVLENGVLYTGSYDGNVYALNATNGAKLWSYQAGERVYVAPIIDHNVVYFGAGNDNVTLSALNAQNGAHIWSLKASISASASLTSANGILYAGANDALYAISEQTGTILWQFPMGTPLHQLIAGSMLYVVGSNSGIYALNPQTGKQVWHNPLPEAPGGQATRLLALGGKLFVETMDISTSPSKAILHALSASDGIEDWYASVSWNISTMDIAA